jgi:hypothetical protein
MQKRRKKTRGQRKIGFGKSMESDGRREEEEESGRRGEAYGPRSQMQ